MSNAASATILQIGERNAGIAELIARVRRSGESAVLTGAFGGARSVALALALRESGRAALILTRDLEQAHSAAQDLNFLLGEDACAIFPEVDIVPYTSGLPGMAVRAARIEVLTGLVAGRVRIVAAPIEALMLRVPAPERLAARALRLRVGEMIALDDLLGRLESLGYTPVPMVEEHGDFSRRGGIVDFYTFGRDNPLRVELDGDEVVGLREFDVVSQRSVSRLTDVVALPTRELLLAADEIDAARATLAGRHPKGEAGADRLVDELLNRRDIEGEHWLAGLFPNRLGDLIDYLPSGALIVLDGPKTILDHVDLLETELRASHREETERGHFFADPDELFLFRAGIQERVSRHDRIVLPGPGDAKTIGGNGHPAGGVEIASRASEGFGRNLNLLRNSLVQHRKEGRRVLILCESEPHRDRLSELLGEWPVEIEIGNLGEGFTLTHEGLVVMTDHEIWGRPRRRVRPRRFRRGILPSELQSLKPGDYVVHVEHGVGVYQGMERLPAEGGQTDCLLITYQKGDKLYVPVDQLDLIQRYSAGEGAAPRVSTLGGTGWQKLKSRVKRRIKIMAEDLIQTYAKRRSLPGHAFGPDTVWQREMEAAFPYDETPDQLTAIDDVKRDMESERPMDRLVCGDVGYGKTEVAIRAAFKAAMEGKQVAVLVPTTLLAEQHLGTFRERMQNFPIHIEMLSRFRTRAEQSQILEKLRLGQIEIVIGTHRLLSKDVVFHNLGLIVVDEEQRFGVRHKEALKKLRTQVDVLTLTATPIPRTLHMALMGARDMSSINTPPRDRQPIHTEIVNFSDDVIVDALLREADRGGQSFFVHNRVMTIENVHVYLSKLVPGLRIGVAHGQMPERQLERVMLDFLRQEYDVLLSTMIIESGLDIPSVNTILIDRADAFGLAQLYQIRGRIGRSARKAFAYLLVPPDRALTETAQKRLRVIDEMEELGSGFQLAMRDLEIRGAGNILGAEQSGFIVNVGFDMYCRLLDEAVRELRGIAHEEAEPARVSTDLDAYLPESYVPDRAEKVKLYKKLADANALDGITGIEEEIRDRFGALPVEGQRLVDLRRLRVLATSMGVRSIVLRAGLFEVLFRRQMTRDEVKALLKGAAVPVEFGSTGDRGFRITRFREASVAEALRLLRVIREAQAEPAVRTPAT